MRLRIKINSTPNYRQAIKIANKLSELISTVLISINTKSRYVNGKSVFGIESLKIIKDDNLDVMIINNDLIQLNKEIESIKNLFNEF